jgi:hypothetical protein
MSRSVTLAVPSVNKTADEAVTKGLSMRVHAERFTVALAAAALAIGLLGAVSATSGGDPQSREKERREKEITVVARAGVTACSGRVRGRGPT